MYRLTQACRNGKCERSREARIVPCCGGEDGETSLPVEYVRAMLSLMRPVPLDGERVLGYWWARLATGRPKAEAVRAALHILGRPVHYSDLTGFIMEHNPAFGRSDERYVLNQLINGNDYVLTGKLGTYGLREWGMEAYVTVGDRIEQMLRDEGRPLLRAGITRPPQRSRCHGEQHPRGAYATAVRQGRSGGAYGWRSGTTRRSRP